MKWVGLYTQKIVSLHALAKEAGTTVGRLCASYSDQKIGNGLSKAELFKNATTGSYTMNQALYLNEVCNLEHNRDTRTPLQYATDLIVGWLCEDTVVNILNNNGIMATLTGSDKDRNFLVKEDITHGADIETPEASIELLFDFTNHWVTYNKLDLRDKKYAHITNNGIHLLGIAPRTMMAIHISPDTMPEFQYGEIPAYGKNGYTLTPVSEYLKPLSQILRK